MKEMKTHSDRKTETFGKITTQMSDRERAAILSVPFYPVPVPGRALLNAGTPVSNYC